MSNLILLYVEATQEDISYLRSKGFNTKIISLPSMSIERLKQGLSEESLSSIFIFDFSVWFYVLESDDDYRFLQEERIIEYFSSIEIQYDPIDHDTLESLMKEPSLLLMAERQRFGYLRNAELTDRIYIAASFWQSLLNHFDIDSLIFGETPHHFDDYILLTLMRIRNSKIAGMQASILNRCYFMNSRLDSIKSDKNIFEFTSIRDQLLKTSENLEDFSNVLPAHNSNTKFTPRQNYQQCILDGLKHPSYNKLLPAAIDYLREIKELSGNSDCDEQNLLYILHMEPEASVYPILTRVGTQVTAIRYLANIFGYKIKLREHPRMFSHDVGQLITWKEEHISSTRRLLRHLVKTNTSIEWSSPQINIEQAIDKACGVVCLNGSSTLISLLKGKPTFISNKSVFNGIPGTISLEDNDLVAAYNKAVNTMENSSVTDRIDLISDSLAHKMRSEFLYAVQDGISSQAKSTILWDNLLSMFDSHERI